MTTYEQFTPCKFQINHSLMAEIKRSREILGDPTPKQIHESIGRTKTKTVFADKAAYIDFLTEEVKAL